MTNQFGIHELEQTMSAPIAWTWKNSYGSRVFTTSLGHEKDFTNPSAVRVIINGVFWSVNQPVPPSKTVIHTRAIPLK